MTDHSALVRRLRSPNQWFSRDHESSDELFGSDDPKEAATALESLVAENKRLKTMKLSMSDTETKAPRITRRAPHMEKYVRIGDNFGTPHQVILEVGNQSFFVGEPNASEEKAVWLRDMVCIALDKLVKSANEPAH